MNRVLYFNYIEERLNLLAERINSRGRLNLLDFHNQTESFYQYLLNELYGWELKNENENKQNQEAIDLIDITNKYVIQVSSTSTKKKIENSLSKEIINKYKDHTFKFISISKDADDLRNKTFDNPFEINFNPNIDIIDKNSILAKIKGLNIYEQKRIYDLVKKELGTEIDLRKLETNIATVINILSLENLDKNDNITQLNSFEIENKIKFNNLITSKKYIEDHKIHYGRIDKIYSEFDTFGINKSRSVLFKIRTCYIKESNNFKNDELFVKIIEEVIEIILKSPNYTIITIDELELCVIILVVDAFIRCKIFENPENYNYVTS